MKKRVSISFDLSDERRYDSLILKLRGLGAEPVLPTQWVLLTPLSVDEVRRELQAHIDPADRILVAHVASMSSRNLIDNDSRERGVA